MGCSQCDESLLPPTSNNIVKRTTSIINGGVGDGCNAVNSPYCKCNELNFRSQIMKMIWDFGFSCFVPSCLNGKQIIKQIKGVDSGTDDKSNESNLEHHNNNNKAWLLAEVGGGCGVGVGGGQLIGGAGGGDEPHSVNSSFRFSFCSQLELDSFNKNSSSLSSASATVLLVNLDNSVTDERSNELRWSRFESLEKSISPVANTLIKFTYAEILSATRNFSEDRVLGRGALSLVYRGRVGFLRTVVAIKRLDKDDKESSKAFCRELMIANSLQHPNIVPLLGFCIDPEEGFFLVYKYVSSGSLEHHLHGEQKGGKSFASFSWSVRYKAAISIAEAIAFLHHGTERCVVHRDIKPSNILLSSKKRPKLCDFGLATWTPAPSVPFLCKTVKGTFGYLAPEYFQHGKVSDKTDVYAFGVVLLELITGRKPIEANRPPGEENLVQWAKPLIEKGSSDIDSILDPRPKITPKSSIQITRMVRAASACIKSEESCRSGIDEVITLLRGEELSCPINNLKTASMRYSQLQTKSQRRSHLALAMLGVSEFEDDDFFYGR